MQRLRPNILALSIETPLYNECYSTVTITSDFPLICPLRFDTENRLNISDMIEDYQISMNSDLLFKRFGESLLSLRTQ